MTPTHSRLCPSGVLSQHRRSDDAVLGSALFTGLICPAAALLS